jgi:hypothetical protein
MEEWKWVKNYDHLYQISNFGRLKSFHKNLSGTILSVKNSKGWYLSVPLIKDGKKTTKRIHRLVVEAFIGEIPIGYEVHHIDGSKQNNHVDNLQIIELRQHRIMTILEHPDFTEGMNKYNKYERPRDILQFTIDGYFIAKYVSARVASEITGICQRNILQVANNDEYKPGMVRKQAGGYVWKFEEKGVV